MSHSSQSRDPADTNENALATRDGDGERHTFGTIAGRETACSTSQTAQQFRAALVSASQWRIVMGRLEFYSATGERFAVFGQRRGRIKRSGHAMRSRATGQAPR